MKTIILPGYSLHNRDWAYDVKRVLSTSLNVDVHEWKHWTKGGFSLKYEMSQIKDKITGEKVNIIAKSIGTRVLMHLLPEISEGVNKVILCGIPLGKDTPLVDDEKSAFSLYKKGLLLLESSSLICFQNSSDPFSSYSFIKTFMEKINKKIRVIEKQGSTHDYPYFEDFKKFLS